MKQLIRYAFLAITVSCTTLTGRAQTFLQQIPEPREVFRLTDGWHFTREDNPSFSAPEHDDSDWQRVRVPHDWAIYGPFSAQNDKQNVAITQDGQKEALEHAGRTGGLPFVGVGWYRYNFKTPRNLSTIGDVTLYIDGAMSHSDVYVNGQRVGGWAYGYNSYYLDITSALDASRTEQVIAIRLENSTDFSRWYPGAGLYRNVYLMLSPSAVRVDDWGTQITTPVITPEYAQVHVKTTLQDLDKAKGAVILRTSIMEGKNVVAQTSSDASSSAFEGVVTQDLRLPSPTLWDLDNPHLYTALSEVLIDNNVVDSYRTIFGVRSVEVIPDKGFLLNGQRVNFRGVCLHHDLGPLGAAVNKVAIARQIKQMKDMGANAIRTSHNMPSPELVQLCNEMGMMLMVESFDEWRIPKVKNGYNLFFDEWAERDLVQLVRHYRNDPAVVMWCIGNEVYEQGAEGGNKIALFLQNICHREDPTRPVTQGMDNPRAVVANNFASVMDIAGFNYRPWHYPEAYQKLPQGLVLGAETTSTVSSRGVYKFPVERRAMAVYDDHQASGYDVEHCSWSNLPEDDWIMHEDYHYNIGEFIWTGIDYLGEPTPYYTNWPSHSSLFGAVDLAGIPKDRFYLYRSHWNKRDTTLHILPHWNWQGREGKVTPIFVYTSYPSAELFINGKSQGKQIKDPSINFGNSEEKGLERQKRYRLMWMNTTYEPGTVKVIAYDESGKIAETKEIATTGAPARLRLILEETDLAKVGIPADNPDRIVYVRVQVTDENGNLVVTANPEITLDVKGAGRYVASANGDPSCIVPFQSKTMPAFSGEMTTIIAPNGESGVLTLTATAQGLQPATLTLKTH